MFVGAQFIASITFGRISVYFLNQIYRIMIFVFQCSFSKENRYSFERDYIPDTFQS